MVDGTDRVNKLQAVWSNHPLNDRRVATLAVCIGLCTALELTRLSRNMRRILDACVVSASALALLPKSKEEGPKIPLVLRVGEREERIKVAPGDLKKTPPEGKTEDATVYVDLDQIEHPAPSSSQFVPPQYLYLSYKGRSLRMQPIASPTKGARPATDFAKALVQVPDIDLDALN